MHFWLSRCLASCVGGGEGEVAMGTRSSFEAGMGHSCLASSSLGTLVAYDMERQAPPVLPAACLGVLSY